ncbi:methylmalonyl-CoA epimerase [Ferrimicrobium acidiphilum]|jgi:methylmalonyl-CoA epimerase|uniref:methylmalonyl-CoA epimerase n=1 Tax=Ferrimicrobium acidiphilum TaxID=121039 RepID=UPI0023F2CB0E|nr:methylmalonyl-CoA epimerase [Ferrimicrobium acidiphilum]MCL5053906.1 methylmalonyl-CoA epimerase [Gammaproteobacteria bacterium]
METTEIDHVAIAVIDLEGAIKRYEILGGLVVHRERVASDGIDEVLLRVAESYIQLLSPFDESSTVARFLDRHGEGLHHIALRVPDCAEALKELVAEGFTLIDDKPRPGSRGTLVAFVHPQSANGTLIELVEERDN